MREFELYCEKFEKFEKLQNERIIIVLGSTRENPIRTMTDISEV